MECKYPDIRVVLIGGDSNAFTLIAGVSRALKNAKVPYLEIENFREEAMSGDYDNLLQTMMKWVTVE